MALVVKYKGKSYDLFDSIGVQASLDNVCGQFTLTTSLNIGMPFGMRSFITIEADGRQILSGFIEKTDGSITNESAMVNFSGRDLLGDLVDSSIPEESSVTEGSISLDKLCQKVIDSLKIKSSVYNLAGTIEPFTQEDIASSEFGGKAGEFLQKFARKRQIFLTTYGNGQLVLFKPPTSVTYQDKLTVDSLLSRNFSYSDAERFNKIVSGAEINVAGGSQEPSKDNSSTSEAIDSEIRSTRFLQVQAEESMLGAELQGKAEEEINIRRARGFNYSCTVPSHQYRIGTLVKVDDELAGVRGTFLIKAVTYNQSDQGNTSELTLCYPETYSGTGKRTSKRKSKIGDDGSKLFPSVDDGTEEVSLKYKQTLKDWGIV